MLDNFSSSRRRERKTWKESMISYAQDLPYIYNNIIQVKKMFFCNHYNRGSCHPVGSLYNIRFCPHSIPS